MTYDIEQLLEDIETLLKATLNNKIAAIEAEKIALGKGIGLLPVNDAAYHQQTWSDKILNRSPAIFYGLEDTQSVGSNSATLDIYKIFVEVVVSDSGMDNFTKNRVHRYSRALKEVFQENFDQFPCTKTNIETVRPISFKIDIDSSEEIKVGGVSITTVLA